MYMLNSSGERTDPCGTPFLSLLNLLYWPLLVRRMKLAVDENLHYELHHMLVWDKDCPHQLQVKSTVPDGVICVR